MTKSNQHQALVKYFLNPKATHLKIISKKKITVKTLSIMLRVSLNHGLVSIFLSSKAYSHAHSHFF